MPIHIGDFLRDTGHLRAGGVGAYLLLLFHHWSTGSLPEDDDQLSSIARLTPAEWRKAKPVIEKFFKPGWRHGRVEEDLEAAKQSYEKRAKAGAEGGKAKARAKQSSSNATAEPEQPLTFNQGKKDSEAKASDAGAPVYTDSRHELWGEGVPILISQGVAEKQARSMIGSWLKSTKDDAQAVLGAIQRARDNRVHNPIPWITNSLKVPSHERNGSVYANPASDQSGSTAVLAGVAAAAERRARERRAAGQHGPQSRDDHVAERADPELFGAR
jgi:uncharacterized protein YdaU (DUF1376 family)